MGALKAEINTKIQGITDKVQIMEQQMASRVQGVEAKLDTVAQQAEGSAAKMNSLETT